MSLRRAPGFTLIEVLIVVILISLIMSVVVGSFTGIDRNQAMQGYIERMSLRVEMARDRAIQTNNEWGIFVETEEISFAEFDHVNQEWLPRTQRPFNLDSSQSKIRFSAKVESYAAATDADEDKLPDVILVF